jgi:hypothetical protein
MKVRRHFVSMVFPSVYEQVSVPVAACFLLSIMVIAASVFYVFNANNCISQHPSLIIYYHWGKLAAAFAYTWCSLCTLCAATGVYTVQQQHAFELEDSMRSIKYTSAAAGTPEDGTLHSASLLEEYAKEVASEPFIPTIWNCNVKPAYLQLLAFYSLSAVATIVYQLVVSSDE